MKPDFQIRDAGLAALAVEFENRVDASVNAHVHALDSAMRADLPIEGLGETVPTYRSLLVHYDPLRCDRDRLIAEIHRLAEGMATQNAAAPRLWHVPVCYGGEHGLDLDWVAGETRMTPGEVAALHAGRDYRVFMIGFSPGFAYLSGPDERLHLPRRTSPRLRIPAGSVIIGGVQAAISPLAMPSGWHILGRTPLPAFDPARAEPFLFAPGDVIRFYGIDAAEFERLEQAYASGALHPMADTPMSDPPLADLRP